VQTQLRLEDDISVTEAVVYKREQVLNLRGMRKCVQFDWTLTFRADVRLCMTI
jgi:non-homologous end joining protein Ku